MKKAMVLLIAALFVSLFLIRVPQARAAADWKQYSQHKFTTYYYDANSIQRSGDVVQVTILGKNTPLGTSLILPEKKIDHRITFAEINCRNKTFFQKRIISYRADGSVVGDYSSDDPDLFPGEEEPYAIHPGSFNDLLFVCEF